MTSRLRQLGDLGQAVWLDFLDRAFLNGGGLDSLVAEGVSGVTTNPSIFEAAMRNSDDYDADLEAGHDQDHADVCEVYENRAVADVRTAAACLREVYDRSGGRDGYVSLEVSPHLADATQATLEEARRLWRLVAAPNLMIKVPGTPAGVPAIRRLIEEGLNVNVTLLFSPDAYEAVAEAFVAGLEARVAAGLGVDGIASVASFFISRIDVEIDKAIDARAAFGEADAGELKSIRGKVAIANAKLAYAWYAEMIASKRWQTLAARGAMPQRLLWASTGTKDSTFPDTLYIDSLIGPDTVNTVAPKTLDAFRDHGSVQITLTEGLDEARHVIAETQRLGLDLPSVTSALAIDGVTQFTRAMDTLLAAIAEKISARRAQ